MKTLKNLFVIALTAALIPGMWAKGLKHEATDGGKPAKEWIRIQASEEVQGLFLVMAPKVSGKALVSLLDAGGNELLKEEMSAFPAAGKQIDLSAMKEGSYVLTVSHSGGYIEQPIQWTDTGIKMDQSARIRIQSPTWKIKGSRMILELDSYGVSKVTVSFGDQEGGVFYSEIIPVSEVLTHSFNLKSLEKGLYFVTVSSHRARFRDSFILED